MFLTQGLQGSAQGFAGVSRDVLAGTVFDAGFAVFCAGFRRGERGWASGDVASGGVRAGMCFFLKLLY